MERTMVTRKNLFARSVNKRATGFACSLFALLALQHTGLALAADAEGIDRQGEGRILYSTIKVPANAETLYVSGMGASPLADESWGNMEQQATDIFTKFKTTLEAQGWKMSDIVQVRVFGIAGEDGVLDFEGFNKAYLTFFGTEENPMKPVRTFVQVADLVREGWLVEVEVQAARVP
jgi:enamine deaminase RidA (YjgF/YER057c/UK114 family)